MARAAAGALGTVGLALAAIAVTGAIAGALSVTDLVEGYVVTNTVIGASFAACGTVLAGARPGNPIGWLILGVGLCHLATAATTVLTGATTGFAAAWSVSIGVLLPLSLQLFPTGHLLSARWRPAAWFTAAAGALFAALAVPASFTGPLLTVSDLSLSLSYLLTLASLVARYRRGDDARRRQLLWLVLALVAVLAVNAPRWLTGEGPILALLAFPLIPAAITIAVLRYGLLDIRLVLSRTLVYGLMTAAVLGTYAGVVAALDTMLRRAGAPAVAALAVAIGFNPVRAALQRVVDRALYGARRDPLRVVSNVGERLRASGGGDLGDVVRTVRSALRVPYAAIRVGPRVVAADGDAVATVHAVPLRYRGDEVGTLAVGLRRGERHLGSADVAVLDLIAVPLASAVHATELTRALQASRERIVAAREEERRRLHRDLHDGLGPALTGLAFKVDAAENFADTDPPAARRLLGELRGDVREAIADVRRAVDGLRPPMLDEVGLIGALRRRADALPFAVAVEAPEPLPPLPAAVEVASLRITTEALTNVARHANAGSARVAVRVDDALHLLVTDDGDPRGPWSPGVGITSIHERAAELGGACECGPTAAGWRVYATLPIEGRTGA
jgi:two-component system, NarL family, sensor kinase